MRAPSASERRRHRGGCVPAANRVADVTCRAGRGAAFSFHKATTEGQVVRKRRFRNIPLPGRTPRGTAHRRARAPTVRG